MADASPSPAGETRSNEAPAAAETCIGVAGAGTMGAGIAQVLIWAGHPVRLYDIEQAYVARGRDQIASFLRRGAEKGRHSSEAVDSALARLTITTDLADMAGVDLVIEAAPERIDIKHELFRNLERVCGAETILATNTSTLSVALIASVLERPERACGLHFFNPAPLMPLVEIVRGPATAARVIETVTRLAQAWGKQPVLAEDAPGFIVNRVARPFYGEGLRLAGERVADYATIDRLARDAGFPMGPFELMDLIGIDVNFAAASAVFEGFFGDPRFRPHPIQRAMVESGRLGRKTGRGYYDYAAGDA
ncbi:MAG: 3-hydroxybutyryl-CoA dehydrogenase [Caldilineae bacterium]|nr:3-hydroxybutyryl-CoA dehydrogenase [Chloroflexota bacterium]MCB9175662.1 3-hydroxybutyryl-CoA dehydrogenase [Caldilineae bacterium]